MTSSLQRGLVSHVAVTSLGAVLLADVAAGATVLTVDWNVEFPPGGGLLTLGDTVLPYRSVTPADDDTSTITLDLPLAIAAAEGERVLSLSTSGEPRSVVEAFVAFDEGEDPVPFTVPTGLRGRVTEDTPSGTPVVVDLSTGQVVDRPELPADLDGASVWNPYLARRAAAQAIPHDTWTKISDWTETVVQGLQVEADGSVTVLYPGFYVIDAGPTFAPNNAGSRAARIMVNNVQRGYLGIPAEQGGGTDVPVPARGVFDFGDNIWVEVKQSSGASLALASASGFSPFSVYRVSV